jgi:hypothetical protein
MIRFNQTEAYGFAGLEARGPTAPQWTASAWLALW